MKKLIVLVILIGFSIAGCGHSAKADPAEEDSFQRALAYSQCMRANGVPDFADPQRDGNKVQINVGKNLNTPALQKALELCRDKLPQRDADGPGGSVDPAKLAEWAKCMRAKLSGFPDADVSGNTITINLKGTGIKAESAEFENARKACESKFPGGSLHVVGQQ